MPRKVKAKRPWQDIAKEAQAERDLSMTSFSLAAPQLPANIPRNVLSIPAQILDSQVVSITNLSPEQLVQKLATGTLSAVDVTTAFLQRAVVAQGLVNCITELLPKLALDRAKELDQYFEEHRKPIGPLHGLPISIKEHVGIEGLRCTTGYVSHWDNISKEDAHILQVLRKAGAVFHCRTTVPQTMMHLETDSNLYGVTNNPYNSNLTSGGSSGGEGALLALRGSCLGIGSDVGGSIRNPAANCGVYGIKPTAFRIPTDGWGYMMAGADTVESVLGPMSTSLSGLELFMKTVIGAQPWLNEPALIPMPWRDFEFPNDRPLRIGVLWDDEIVRPHPPILRAMTTMATRLQERGVEVVDFKPYKHEEAWVILASLYFPDGGEADLQSMKSSGEPLRPLTKSIIEQNEFVKKLSVGELAYWLEEREAYRKEYAHHWNGTGVDALLCPVGPGVAPKHNTAKYWWYTSQWNLLDYPGVAFPVCKVDVNTDKLTGRQRPLSDHDKFNRDLWDPEEFQGLPVSLQLVGRRFEDEKILSILKYITAQVGLPLDEFP